MLKVFHAYFDFIGCSHLLVDSAKSCLDLIKSGDEKFDVIILDNGLYGMIRLELAKRIFELIPDQQIILTTATDSEDMWKEAEAIGIKTQNILLKPFSLDRLLSTVKQAVSRTVKVGLRDHILACYNSVTDQLSEAVQFFKNGIENNESLMFIMGNNLNIELVKNNFISNGIDVDRFLPDRSLILTSSNHWYIPYGKVDKDRLKNQWLELVNKCLKNGKKGLRAFCMTDTFFEHNLIDDLVEYESALPPKFDFELLPICAYLQTDIDKLSQKQKERMFASHSHVWMPLCH